MSNRLPRSAFEDVRTAVLPNTGPADAVITATAVDATGYRRARFVFSFGALSGSAHISTGFGIWNASTSGATSALITGASGVAITSGVLSGYIAVIDVPVDQAKPWLLVSNLSTISSNCTNACTVQLYNANNRPPTTSTPNQMVVVAS